MNKELASILRDKLTDIPFIEVFGGLVYVQQKKDRYYISEEDTSGYPIEKRFPVTCDHIGADCGDGDLLAMIPNNKKKGILYFEDWGLSVNSIKGDLVFYNSSLRLVAWLNTKFIDLSLCRSLMTPVISGIIQRISGKNPFNEGNLQAIDVSIQSIPQTNADIFNRYTYDNATIQYLMPPYEFFALDIRASFRVSASCLAYVPLKNPECI